MIVLKILDQKHAIAAKLRGAGIEESMREASYILAAALGLDRVQLMAIDDFVVTEDMLTHLVDMVTRRAAREPLARIIGHQAFWGLDFGLNEATLIPRADTEALIEQVLDIMPNRTGDYAFADLGTGTGCILLSLLHEYKNARGVGVDLSARALEQTALNAMQLKLQGRATFAQGSWLEGEDDAARAAIDVVRGKTGFDLIVSNPPYIVEADLFTLQPEVRVHDPMLALDGGADGLVAYRALIPQAAVALRADGWLAVEIGQGQEGDVAALMQAAGLGNLRQRADLAGIIRVVAAQKPA